jgi:hypothetical protein
VTVVFGGAVILMLAVLVNRTITPPDPGLGVERACADAIVRTMPDLSWVAPDRERRIQGRDIRDVTLALLPFHDGDLVRVAGVLRAEFEWVALYRSASAMRERSRAPWVSLDVLWRGEPFWQTKGPLISGRCVRVVGTYYGGAHTRFGMFDGAIRDVVRLDVWSTVGLAGGESAAAVTR